MSRFIIIYANCHKRWVVSITLDYVEAGKVVRLWCVLLLITTQMQSMQKTAALHTCALHSLLCVHTITENHQAARFRQQKAAKSSELTSSAVLVTQEAAYFQGPHEG